MGFSAGRVGELGWTMEKPDGQEECSAQKAEQNVENWITRDHISFGFFFFTDKGKISKRFNFRGRVIMKLEPTEHKHSDLLKHAHWSSFYMSQSVPWTSECKAISLSVLPVPSPPNPDLISSIPKQKLLLWEKCSATYVAVEHKPACKHCRQHVCT